MTSAVLHVACTEPGAAAAVAPVAALLQNTRGVTLRIVASEAAATVFERTGLAVERVAKVPTVEVACAELSTPGVRALLAGTSARSIELEKPYIAAARSISLPSVAVVEHWSSYRERFTDEHGSLSFVPDRVAVVDEKMRRGLVAAGIPGAVIVVTGGPQFDDLADAERRWTPEERRALRRRIGAEDRDLVVLFVSQPIAASYGSDLGYTEATVLATIAGALDRFARERELGIVLALRPHPRETTALEPPLGRFRAASAAGEDARACVLASDLVVGMFSALLVEASYLGRVTVSVQLTAPGGRRAVHLDGVRHLALTEADVYSTLGRALSEARSRARPRPSLSALSSPGATHRVADLVRQMGGFG